MADIKSTHSNQEMKGNTISGIWKNGALHPDTFWRHVHGNVTDVIKNFNTLNQCKVEITMCEVDEVGVVDSHLNNNNMLPYELCLNNDNDNETCYLTNYVWTTTMRMRHVTLRTVSRII